MTDTVLRFSPDGIGVDWAKRYASQNQDSPCEEIVDLSNV